MLSMFANTKLEEIPTDEKKADVVDAEEQKKTQESIEEKKQDTTTTMSKEKENKDKCCALTLDIISTVCLYIMAIFFLVGSTFILPQVGNYGVTGKISFWTLGVLFYLTYASIEIFNNRSKGVLAIVMSVLALFSGVLWFIGSIFLFRGGKVYKEMPFFALWLCGALCNLGIITFAIVKVFMKHGPKPLFLVISLILSWLANFLFFAGSAHFAASLKFSAWITYCSDLTNLVHVGGSLLAGSLLYLIHAIFHTLALFKGGITFKVEFDQNS